MHDEQNRDIQLQHDRDPRSNSIFIYFEFYSVDRKKKKKLITKYIIFPDQLK